MDNQELDALFEDVMGDGVVLSDDLIEVGATKKPIQTI